MNHRSITFRLAGWYAGVSLLVCAGFGLCTYLGLGYSLWRGQAERLQRRAHSIAAILSAHAGREGESYAIELIKTTYAPENNDRFIRIRSQDGSLLYLSGAPADRSFDPAAIPILPLQPARLRSLGNLLLVQAGATANGRQYLVDCGASKLADMQVQRHFLGLLGISVPVVVLIVAGGGAVLVRQAFRPVRRIIDAAQDITSSNLSQRLPVADTADDLEHLSVVLNQMIGRIEEGFQHSQRFSADVSHELRTPLTIMRVELESVGQEPGLDPAIREKIASILEETERMGKIVEDLLAISRFETGEAAFKVTRFDLAALVSETAEQISLLTADKHLSVLCQAAGPVEISGDRFRIQQAIVNLLDNSIKYSPPGGQIALATRAETDEAVIEVSDNGPGIPPEAIAHVFERFFRADTARTHSVSGTGLGLSIVRSICQAHGGTAEAANRPEGGCRITLRLPLAQPSGRPSPVWVVSRRNAAPAESAESAL